MKAYFWDANTAFHQVLDDPKKYGFTNITGYGKTGDLWGNSFHPSSASMSRVVCNSLLADHISPFTSNAGQAHHLWAKEVAAVLNGTVWL